MSKNNFPAGWDEDRVKRLIARYEQQTEDEAVAEDEAVYENPAEHHNGSSNRISSCGA